MTQPTSPRSRLADIDTFDELLVFLRDELDWPIENIEVDDLTFDYDPINDLGIAADAAAKVTVVKQLRPLSRAQAWDIFYVEFEPRYLSLRLMQRILKALVSNVGRDGIPSNRKRWRCDDLLFVSASGRRSGRRIDFVHFSQQVGSAAHDIRVLGWHRGEPVGKLEWVEHQLREGLRWPAPDEADTWRQRWRNTFLTRPGRERGAWADLDEHDRRILIDLYSAADLTVDALPYTADFDWMAEAFNEATGLSLASHDFWRALSSARKSGQLPRKQR